ncbi:MAG: PEP-CTERM sorting domain-containing protein [Limisphaerales bacterium]
MKKKKASSRKLTPVPAAAAVLALAASAAHAQSTPVFNYQFPASWNGTTSAVADQSSAGNNGTYRYGLTLAAAPPTDSGNSISDSASASATDPNGGFYTDGTSLLPDATVAADGGFQYNIDFNWNGTFSSSFGGIQKLLDYSGTESLQLVAKSGTVATLEMTFNPGTTSSGATEIAALTTILPNTWYDVTFDFNTEGNSVVAGDLTGVGALYVDGTLVSSGGAIKGVYGDSLARPIGIGQFGYAGTDLIGFNGDIYNPSVNLGSFVVPEPSSLALSLLGGIGVLGMSWNGSRRKRWSSGKAKS